MYLWLDRKGFAFILWVTPRAASRFKMSLLTDSSTHYKPLWKSYERRTDFTTRAEKLIRLPSNYLPSLCLRHILSTLFVPFTHGVSKWSVHLCILKKSLHISPQMLFVSKERFQQACVNNHEGLLRCRAWA